VVDPQKLSAWLRAEVKNQAGDDGISAADRERELQQLEAELAEVERQEVETFWSADAAGLNLSPRADINFDRLLGLVP
jgi:hypothetical protein